MDKAALFTVSARQKKLEFPKKDLIAKPLNFYKRLHVAYKTKVFCLH